MSEVELRAPQDGDAAAVAEIFSRPAPEPISAATVRRAWASPELDVEQNVRVAVVDGRITGFVDVEDYGRRGEKFWSWLRGEPADVLIAWVEERATALARGPARLFVGSSSTDDGLRRALARRGFRVVRRSYRMAIDLDRDLEAPTWPAGIGVRTFDPRDERAVYEAHMETFEDSWEFERATFEEWSHWMLEREQFDPTLWFLVEEDGELAGIALCTGDDVRRDVGWVSILGVRRRWRRHGLGRALLLHAFGEFARRGFRTVVLGVDAESLTGAQRLYESAGMRVVHVSETYEKEIAS